MPKEQEKNDVNGLRQRAERRVRKAELDSSELTREEAIRLVNELEVHQVELEIQNEELRVAREELARARDRYADLYDFAPVGYVTMDKHAAITQANVTVCRMLRVKRADLLKRRLTEFIAPESQNDFYLHRREALRTGNRQSCELTIHCPDGGSFYAEMDSVRDSDGLRGAITDVSERKRVEEVLRESEEFASFLGSSPIPMLVVDPDTSIRYLNPALERLTGLTAAAVIGTRAPYPWSTEETLEKTRADLRNAMGRGSHNLEEVFKKKDGERFHVEITSTPVTRGGQLRYYLSTWVDITERKRAEEQIREFQRRLRSLASRLSMAEERERKRLAAGVHDEITQPLGILKMRLGELNRSELPADAAERLGPLEALVDQMIADTRSLMFDMSPPVLYELGLEAALEWLCEQVQAEHGITCVFNDDGQPKPLGDDARGLLFWDARELLANVVKHAHATTATVSIGRRGNEVHVTVEDDGVGFDAARAESRAPGFGLFSIRERLTEFGGRMELRSARGKGTRVTLVASLDHRPDSASE